MKNYEKTDNNLMISVIDDNTGVFLYNTQIYSIFINFNFILFFLSVIVDNTGVIGENTGVNL
jgi:hypothetical protein